MLLQLLADTADALKKRLGGCVWFTPADPWGSWALELRPFPSGTLGALPCGAHGLGRCCYLALRKAVQRCEAAVSASLRQYGPTPPAWGGSRSQQGLDSAC